MIFLNATDRCELVWTFLFNNFCHQLFSINAMFLSVCRKWKSRLEKENRPSQIQVLFFWSRVLTIARSPSMCSSVTSSGGVCSFDNLRNQFGYYCRRGVTLDECPSNFRERNCIAYNLQVSTKLGARSSLICIGPHLLIPSPPVSRCSTLIACSSYRVAGYGNEGRMYCLSH